MSCEEDGACEDGNLKNIGVVVVDPGKMLVRRCISCGSHMITVFHPDAGVAYFKAPTFEELVLFMTGDK